MTNRLGSENAFNKYCLPMLLVSASVSGVLGCSGAENPSSAGIGGSSAVGGATAADGSGGSSVANGTGGAPSTGGANSSVANVTGGAPSTGGGAATGGVVATGGRTASTGGNAPTGGSPATGGKAPTGGTASATGGKSAGGSSTTSTVSATGGKSAGGGSATGGSTVAGGSTAAGGTTAAGGSSGSRSPGCGKAISRPNPKTQQTLDIQGTTRYYLLDVPTAADNQTPLMLIFALHGYDMNNVSVTGLYNFTSRAAGKAITVYPQGEGPAPGDVSHWGDGVLKSTWTGNTANYTFMQTLMTDLESRFCIDPSRVFITGFSMGGMFTNSIACDHNDWFRGFAPVEGMGPGSCSNANAKPAIMIHQGTADTTVTPTAGGEPTRDFWVKQNGCSQTTTSTFTGCTSYSTCAQPVAYCVGNWNHTINSTISANIWSFFSGLP